MIAAGQDVLILKRASASRLRMAVVVGRIFKANAVPVGSP
jgi:hypothetical protein